MEQGVLLRGDAVMIVALLLEYFNRPLQVCGHEVGVGPTVRESLSSQRLDLGANPRDIIRGAHMLSRIEYSQIPVGFACRCSEIQQRGEHGQIPRELRRGARRQPLSLPVPPVAQPIDRAHRADQQHFANSPGAGIGMQFVRLAVPTQGKRQHGAQHGQRAEQIDRPESTAIAMPEVDGPLIEFPVLRREGFDERRQRRRRNGSGRCRRGFEPHADQQEPLD